MHLQAEVEKSIQGCAQVNLVKCKLQAGTGPSGESACLAWSPGAHPNSEVAEVEGEAFKISPLSKNLYSQEGREMER